MRRTTSLTLSLLFISTVCIAQSRPPLNRDPKTVKFVTSDIANFWQAYDLAAKETDKTKRVAIFQTEYLAPADLGYYVGYLITQAYYRKAKDKRQAVHDILNIQDATCVL